MPALCSMNLSRPGRVMGLGETGLATARHNEGVQARLMLEKHWGLYRADRTPKQAMMGDGQ